MRALDIALERIYRKLISGNVGLALAETDTYLTAWPNPQTKEKRSTLKDEYRLMESYWQQGIKDPQLNEQYRRLLQRTYTLFANMAIYRHIVASSYLQTLYTQSRKSGQRWSLDAVRSELEGFVTDVAMLELEPEAQRAEKSRAVYQHHQQQMNALFNFIVTSNVWTDGVGQTMEEILLLPTTDSIDQQLMVSAVTLSAMNCFDIAKFRLLVHVYQHAQDEEVRQRALVGWVLCIDDDFCHLFPEMGELVGQVLQSKRCCQELTELQMQLIYTVNSEEDTTKIQKEIVPGLFEGQSLRVTRSGGIEEVEEDPLEDVLHPDAAEQRMEKLEASFQRMMDMQKQGVDIYFGGFSQMKRFPFFYDMSNWLVPFYMQHPDIARFVDKQQGNKFLEYMMKAAPFCNSDKYSFVIAFQQVVDKLPENMRQMMKRGELKMAEVEQEELQLPAYIRRIYLMDLFRFFRLFPNRSALWNPFDTTRSEMGMCMFFMSSLFSNTPLESRKPAVVSLLKKRKLEDSAMALLETFPDTMRDIQYYLWTRSYSMALRIDPDNERALLGRARRSFEKEDYEAAEADYDRLMLLFPEKKRYMLNKAVCLVKSGNYEEAVPMLYQLNYEQPDNDYVSRALAWALTCEGKLEQAEKIYGQLTAREAADADDYLNMGYCLWLQGRIGDAAAAFRQHVQLAQLGTDDTILWEYRMLLDNGISDTDIQMMESLVFS